MPMHRGTITRILYALFALGTAHLLLLAGVESQRAWVLHQELQIVSSQVKALEVEVRELKSELAHAADPAYLEARARALGYVYPEEVLRAPPR